MGVGTAGGVTGVLTAALFSAKSWLNPVSDSPVFYSHVEITPQGGTFSDWSTDQDGVEVSSCEFWNATHYYSPRICDPFGVSRISISTGEKAVQRAIKCAAQYDTQCILSGEIGFSAPAAFLYDSEQGFRMILAPRFVPTSNPGEQRLIRLQDPSETSANTLMRFNSTIEVEFIAPGSRQVLVETLSGQDAYCVQMLRASVSPACWSQLD